MSSLIRTHMSDQDEDELSYEEGWHHVSNQPPSSPGESSSEVTPPYLARTLPTHESSTSSSSSRTRSRRRHRHHDHDNSSDLEELPTSAKLLSRLVSRYDHRDTKHMRTLLVLTTDRLETETRRADQAEQRIVDTLQRLRDAHEATAVAQTDASRARQDLRMHQMQLEQAQREITRAQNVVDQLEQARREADQEAANARDTARKLREQLVFSKAREEGRKEGYDEGFKRGRAAAMAEAEALLRKRSQSARPPARRSPPSPLKPQVSVEQASSSGSSSSSGSPLPMPVQVQRAPPRTPLRPPSAPIPTVHRVTPPVLYSNLDRRQAARTPQPARVPDVAPIASTLPIPTLVTPLNAPSPSHTRPPPKRPEPAPAPSPQAIPVPPPGQMRDRSPIPIRNAPPSPRHPDYDIIPDNFIPYAPGQDPSNIHLPPAHELSRPVSPVSLNAPSPAPETKELPVPPPPAVQAARPVSVGPEERIQYSTGGPGAEKSTPRGRPRAYTYGAAPPPPPSAMIQKAPSTVLTSPQSQSRASTLNHYDLLKERIYRQGVDRDSLRSGKSREYTRPGAVPIYSSQAVHRAERDESDDEETLLEKFRTRYKEKLSPRSQKSPAREGEGEPSIKVQSPTTSSTSTKPKTVATTVDPDLLSPEYNQNHLPPVPVLPVRPPQLPSKASSTDTQSLADSHRGNIYRSTTPGMSRAHTPSQYAEAPLPAGVTYPTAPGRSKSRASSRAETGTLSPISLSLGKAFSSFAAP